METVIAILALLTSACASVAALFQSREAVVQTRATIAQTQTVASQLGASVWPYLTVDDVFSPRHLGVSITNQGLGPALIRTFSVAFDRRALTHFQNVIDLFDPKRRGRSVGENDIGGGSVIRPSQSYMIFSIDDAKLDEIRAQATIHHLRIDICYCSLLAECWTLDSNATEPKMVKSCGTPTARILL